ncbi:MAG: efflux RND transporter periplasmic adaptor subunit [Bacteroidales bacterium]|nr:efflux RND transporter periplasmic adaptor subunit [Bacteroidales bacterium]MCM1416529.1 efflux RND transporter periplasmic adaptor subunit [bacterium]MCM1424534.1 efflux RND transporter periplasmic adaptor subunit [bacterium]
MRRQYIKSERKRAVFFLAAACLSVTLAGCGETEEEETLSEVIPVEAQMPEAGTLTLENEFIGTVSPEEAVYVIPMVTAEVVSTDIQVGDTVTAGQELCKLDTEAAKLQLESAEAQYNSAAAGVAAAEVGYEIAQAQYDSTVAQLDMQNEQTQRQKDLTMYQMQMQIDSINNGIDDINEQLGDLEENKKDAEDQRDTLNKAQKNANAYVKQAQKAYNEAAAAYQYEAAQQRYYAAVAAVTALENPDPTVPIPDRDTLLAAAKAELKEAEETLKTIEDALKPLKDALSAAQAAASQASSASAQLEAGIDQIEDGEEQLRNTLSDTYQSKEQTETIKNLTEAQLNIDTQDVQDIGKRTAALGVESAAAQVNSAKVGAEGAKLGIESAEYQLDMYTLTAPIDGIIEAVNVKEHDFASPQSPAFVISNKNTMTVTFGVSEGIRATLRVGQKITVDRNGKLYDAAITEIGSMIDQNTGLFVVKSCVSTPDDSLLTGSSVKVTAQTYSQADAILIPYDAVYYDNSQPYVYVAADGFAKRLDVETGIFDEETITVLDGLSTEDVLITSWSANLREGAEVSVQMKSEGKDDAGETAGGE